MENSSEAPKSEAEGKPKGEAKGSTAVLWWLYVEEVFGFQTRLFCSPVQNLVVLCVFFCISRSLPWRSYTNVDVSEGVFAHIWAEN